MTLSEINAEENKREEEEKAEGASPEKKAEDGAEGEKPAEKTNTEPDVAAEDSKAENAVLATDPASRS